MCRYKGGFKLPRIRVVIANHHKRQGWIKSGETVDFTNIGIYAAASEKNQEPICRM